MSSQVAFSGIMPSSTKSPVTRDLLNNEKIHLEDEHLNDRKEALADHRQKQSLGLANDMSLCMFRKYLLPKGRINSMPKTDHQDPPEITKSEQPLLSPMYMSRPPSLLEQSILPGIRSDASDSIRSPSNVKSSPSQLTIFYAGVINVYENVPVDKAQAIMLLAGESSLSKPIDLPNSSGICKSVAIFPPSNSLRSSQSELPIARKTSLQHFLERRRHRITSKSPYSHISSEDKEREATTENEHSEGAGHNIYLSPFPSRFGFLFPASKATSGSR